MNKRQRNKHNKFKGYNIHLMKTYDMINDTELVVLWWGGLGKDARIYKDFRMYIHKSKRAFTTDLNRFGRYILKKCGISKGRLLEKRSLVKYSII